MYLTEFGVLLKYLFFVIPAPSVDTLLIEWTYRAQARGPRPPGEGQGAPKP